MKRIKSKKGILSLVIYTIYVLINVLYWIRIYEHPLIFQISNLFVITVLLIIIYSNKNLKTTKRKNSAKEGETIKSVFCGKSISGNFGMSISGDKGTSITGHYGICMSGIGGKCNAGKNGIIQILYLNKKNTETLLVGKIGINGLKPDTFYKVETGKFVEVD